MRPPPSRPVHATPNALLILAVLAAASPAQTTWIVDRSSGPGTHFTDLPPAVAAASLGDIIVVRTGSYSGFSTNKGLTLIGESGPPFISASGSFATAIVVDALPTGQVFAMANFFVTFIDTQNGIDIRNSAGRVHLQDLQVTGSHVLRWAPGTALRVTAAATVTIAGGQFVGAPAVATTDADLAMTGTTLIGLGSVVFYGIPLSNGAGLDARNSHVTLSRSDVYGGNGGLVGGVFPIPAQPAIAATDSEIVVTGLVEDQIYAGIGHPTNPTPAISAQLGSVLADTQIDIQGSSGGPPISGTATVERRRVVAFVARGGALGGTIDSEVASPAGDLVAVFAGLPIAAAPSPFGTLYVDLATAIPLAFGVPQPAAEQLPLSVRVPDVLVLRGAALALQAANYYRATGMLEMSAAAVVVLR